MNGLIIPGYLLLALMGEPLEAETTAPPSPEPQVSQTLEEVRAILVALFEEREALTEAEALETSLQRPWIGGRFGVDHIPASSI